MMFSAIRFITAVYAVFLTLLLWLPDPRTILFGWEPGEGPAGFAHLITFSILGFLVELGRRKYSFFVWATLLFGYVFLTEIVQELLPAARSFDIFDIMQDLAGLYVGLWTAAAGRAFVKFGKF
ncbi:MAG: VanZ family protein [Planctomycetaceae bacterium]|jgi:hypothetical protein|nr:VanZ family protein [Planctomycetaceae bacterium]